MKAFKFIWVINIFLRLLLMHTKCFTFISLLVFKNILYHIIHYRQFQTLNCGIGFHPIGFSPGKNLVTFLELVLMLDCSSIHDHFAAVWIIKNIYYLYLYLLFILLFPSSSESRSSFCTSCHNLLTSLAYMIQVINSSQVTHRLSVSFWSCTTEFSCNIVLKYWANSTRQIL